MEPGPRFPFPETPGSAIKLYRQTRYYYILNSPLLLVVSGTTCPDSPRPPLLAEESVVTHSVPSQIPSIKPSRRLISGPRFLFRQRRVNLTRLVQWCRRVGSCRTMCAPCGTGLPETRLQLAKFLPVPRWHNRQPARQLPTWSVVGQVSRDRRDTAAGSCITVASRARAGSPSPSQGTSCDIEARP